MNVDHTWLPIETDFDSNIQLSKHEPELYYVHPDPERLQTIRNTHHNIIEQFLYQQQI